ncbi:MAG: DUF2058 family protein [Candidatus Eisenbacteria bacterium]|nr:DUF2058 family protein [Candidatus Eisenbacteria bacterium]
MPPALFRRPFPSRARRLDLALGANAMADMRDALRKAGLVSEKEARRAAHEKRVRRKELGDEGLAAESERKEARYRAERAAQREADQARAVQQRAADAARQSRERLATLIARADELPRAGGSRRFHFVAAGGRIHFLDVSDLMLRRLIQGQAAIVSAPELVRGGYAILAGPAAAALRQIDPERILHWNAAS